jgi:hypothetical protein
LKVQIFDPERIFVKMDPAEKNRKNRTGLRFRLTPGALPGLQLPFAAFRGRWLVFPLSDSLDVSAERLIRRWMRNNR